MANRADMQTRQEDILKMLRQGKLRYEIKDFILTKYGVSDTTFNRDLIAVYNLLKEENEQRVANLASLQTERLELLWKKSMEDDDKRTALEVLKTINKIGGLETNKVELGTAEGLDLAINIIRGNGS